MTSVSVICKTISIKVVEKGNDLLTQKAYSKAINDYYIQALKAYQDNFLALYYWAVALEMQKSDEAMDILLQALELEKQASKKEPAENLVRLIDFNFGNSEVHLKLAEL